MGGWEGGRVGGWEGVVTELGLLEEDEHMYTGRLSAGVCARAT